MATKTAKDIFRTKNITRMAVFTVLAYLLYMPIFEFSLIPSVPFLKVDFSNAFVLMAGFAMGPIEALIVGVLKEILHSLTFSQTVGVGELANIIIMLPFVLIPSIAYRKHRNIKTVIISLVVGCVAQAVWSIPTNYILTFPFFLMAYAGAPDWSTGMNFYLSVWYWAVLFNFAKTIMVSCAVLLLYKQFQRLFRFMFNERSANVDKSEKIVIKSARAMEKLGKRLADDMTGGDVILLTGELGAGKTVLCKGIAKGLGVKTQVVSPTFTIMNEYFGRVEFCHFDAYRIADADEAAGAGLTDFIGNSDCVCAVEWWENIEPLFEGLKTTKITIKKLDEKTREVTIIK